MSFPSFGIQTTWTISVWMKRTAITNGLDAIICENQTSLFSPVNMSLHNSNDSTKSIYTAGFYATAGIGSRWFADNTSALALNIWYCVTATWDGITMRCYVNDTITGTVTPTYRPTPQTMNADYFIGKRGTANYFIGEIGKINIYGTALADTDVASYYATTKARYGL